MTDDQETAVAPSGSLFDVGSAELWRLGQRRRARYIIKLLHQMLASLSSKQPHAQFVSTDEIETGRCRIPWKDAFRQIAAAPPFPATMVWWLKPRHLAATSNQLK